MEYNIEEKDREINFRQCLLYIWEHIVPVLVVTVLFGASFCGYSLLKQGKSKAINQTIKDIVTQNRSAYYPDGSKTVINTERKKLDKTCIIRGEIFIDYDFSSIEGNSNLDYSAMVARLQQDALLRMVGDSTLKTIAENVNKKEYTGLGDNKITSEQLRWFINISFGGANVMQYSVTDVCTERALDIGKQLSDAFVKEASTYETIDSVRILEEPDIFSDDTSSISSGSLKSAIKLGAVGAVVGFILICGVYFLIFVFADYVRVSADVDYTDLNTIGILPQKEKMRSNEIKRIAYNLSLHNATSKILVAPVDKKSNTSLFIESVKAEFENLKSNITLIDSDNIIDSADASIKANDADAIILFATFGKTRVKDIEFARDEMKKTGKNIVGVIINNAKHK